MVKLDVLGQDKLLAAFNNAEKKLRDGVDRELSASAITINAEQKALTPVNTGNLQANNVVDTSKYLTKVLENKTTYAPYMEWGTGGFVDVPAELAEEAIVFKGAGKRKINIMPRPFFFGPYFRERSKLITRLKKMLTD